jgi:phytoene/squalene synthetase
VIILKIRNSEDDYKIIVVRITAGNIFIPGSNLKHLTIQLSDACFFEKKSFRNTFLSYYIREAFNMFCAALALSGLLNKSAFIPIIISNCQIFNILNKQHE